MSISIDQIDIGSVVEVSGGILTILGFDKSLKNFVGEGSTGIHNGNIESYWYDKKGNKIPYWGDLKTTNRIYRNVDSITAVISDKIPQKPNTPPFKVGDRVRLKSHIKSENDISDKDWKGIGKVSISKLIGRIHIIRNVNRLNSPDILDHIRLENNMYDYPITLFELANTETQSSNTLQDDIKVGDYIFVGKAGGWGYSSSNNNSIAKVTKIQSRPSKYGRCFAGTILEPKYNSTANFYEIPEIVDGETIIRKATLDDFNRLGVSLPREFQIKQQSDEDYSGMRRWGRDDRDSTLDTTAVKQSQHRNITLSYEDDEDDYIPRVIPTKNITIN